MADLHSVCEQFFKNHAAEIKRIGYNGPAIQSLIQKDYPSLDQESLNRCADVIQLMLMNNKSSKSISA